MHIYIEMDFLDNFYMDYDSKNQVQKIVYDLLTDYPETKWFIDVDIDTVEKLEQLKQDNPIFALKAAIFMPVSVQSLKEHLFSIDDLNQTLVFTQNKQEWFSDAEKKGVLCFSFDVYQEKIQTIINKSHYKIDLGETFENWNKLAISVPFNKIVVNDGYILTDKSNQKMDKNLFPLLKVFLENNKSHEIKIEVFTSDFNPPQPKTTVQIKEEASKRLMLLNNVFVNYKVKFKIINNSKSVFSKYDFHDRTICNNFQMIECGKGFNLIPHTKSNSQIISETIFDKYTYKRLKNLLKMHEECFFKVSNLQTINFIYLE